MTEVIKTQAQFTLDELWRMGTAFARSSLFKFQSVEDAVTLLLIAQAEGKHPVTAMQEFDIIDGKPSLKASAMLGRFQNAGGRIKWDERSDERCAAEFFHPAIEGAARVEWTIQDARKAGLAGKKNWQKHPRQMLSARVVSEGVRACFPACLSGMHLPGEVEVETVDITPEKTTPEATVSALDQDMSNKDVRTIMAHLEESIVYIDGVISNSEWPDQHHEDHAFSNQELLDKLPEDMAAQIEQIRKEHLMAQVEEVPF